MSRHPGAVCLALLIAVAGCVPVEAPSSAKAPAPAAAVAVDDPLVQFSLAAALASGDYEGDTPLREILNSGDFGLGTFSRLDGELILLEGQIYQALANGTLRPADLAGNTPFAAVTFFQEDGRLERLAAPTLDSLEHQLDRQLPRRNVPYALRLDGDFAEITFRSVPPQTPPFRPLVEVIQQQVTSRHRNLRGTLIGLRCPAWIGTLNVSGYHWHFLSEDRTLGGHVLACELRDGSLRYDECTSLVIHLPRSRAFEEFDAGQINKQDIDRIERQRTGAEAPTP